MRFSVAVCAFGTWILAGTAFAETLVERGEYLVQGIAGCGNCHTPMGPNGPVWEQDLGGRLVEKIDAFTAIAPNITPGGRVASWSDAELARAIREGIRPDGSLIGPPMPYAMYRGLSDRDLSAIVAYLRTVPAVENDPGTSQ
ncbi:MAG: c-type cytochrome, partial [Paracoccaceae bacterium]